MSTNAVSRKTFSTDPARRIHVHMQPITSIESAQEVQLIQLLSNPTRFTDKCRFLPFAIDFRRYCATFFVWLLQVGTQKVCRKQVVIPFQPSAQVASLASRHGQKYRSCRPFFALTSPTPLHPQKRYYGAYEASLRLPAARRSLSRCVRPVDTIPLRMSPPTISTLRRSHSRPSCPATNSPGTTSSTLIR